MSKAFALGGLLAMTVSLAASPQTAPQSPPVFRSGVDLVTVDATVVDRDGKPVIGLKPEDFVVTLDGKRRAVRALDYLEFGASIASSVDAAARATNQVAPAGQSRGGRVILLVVDDLSAKPTQMMGLRVAAQKMLGMLDAGDLVGLATTSGLGPIVNPTRDRAVVKAALDSKDVFGRNDDTTAPFYVSIPEAFDITRNVAHSFAPDRGYSLDVQTTFARVVRRECFDLVGDPQIKGPDDGVCTTKIIGAAAQLSKNVVNRAAAQLSAYAQLIGALRPAPAPRVIVALSAGVALGVDQGSFGDLEPVSLAAAKAGVQLYALAEVQDAGDINDLGPDRATARRDEDAFLISGVQTVATAAGGEAFKVVGQADRFFRRIVAETSGVYQLGVEMPVAQASGEFVNVKVSVSRPDVSVRTKAHALAASVGPEPARRSSALAIETALQLRIAQGGASFGVPVAVATALRRDPAGDRLQLGVSVQVPAVVTGPVIAMYAVVNEQGRIIQDGRKQLAGTPQDYQIAVPVLLDPGTYRLRVAVADAGGAIGSVEHAVTAALAHLGTCAVSDLSTTWSGADDVSHFLGVETLPDAATSLRVSLELYPDNPSAAPVPIVRLALIREGDDAPIVEQDLTPTGTGATRVVSASVPAGQLKPGAYRIRATLLESGAVTGTVSAVVRKR